MGLKQKRISSTCICVCVCVCVWACVALSGWQLRLVCGGLSG